MRILIACEFSGIVRDAFTKRGHFAVSCDLLPTERPGRHFQCNVLRLLDKSWDMMIAHPPCTYLAASGNKWYGKQYADRFPDRFERLAEGAVFFMQLALAPIPQIAVENPIGRMSSLWRKPDQIIQPYQFGHDVRKATCLWLKNLSQLRPTRIVQPTLVRTRGGNTMSKWHVDCGHHKNRSHERSRTFQGVADAMAEQWG